MTHDSLLRLSIAQFLERLASAEPTPGGGATAALSGATGAALGRMVIAYTVGRPKYAADQAELTALDEALERSVLMLGELLDEDAAAYAVLSAELKRDKGDSKRAARVAKAAALAGSVPLQTAAVCARVLAAAKRLSEIGNTMLRSDAQCAAHLARSGLLCAAENVRANLPLMADDDGQRYAAELEHVLQSAG